VGTDLSIADGNTIDLSSIDTDTDTDEQTLSLSGTNLSISNGNTVDLASISGIDSDWQYSGLNIYSGIGHNVGIGTSSPVSRLHVNGATRMEALQSLSAGGVLAIGTPGGSKSIHINQFDIQAYTSGIADGTVSVNKFGGDVFIGDTDSEITLASGTFFLSGADNMLGLGTSSPANRLDIEGLGSSTLPVVDIEVNYSGFSDVEAISTYSIPADGFGTGGKFTGGNKGVEGIASGGTTTYTTYGVYGKGSGAGTSIGVYGRADGTGTNWASYFVGDNYMSGSLNIGTLNGATGYMLSVDGKIIA
jgi:hypothetical protein